jgi:octaprenyl-diphosphate synthase
MTLKEIIKPVEKHLDDFNDFFKETMKSNVPLLDLIIKYMTKKRGKQVRPLIVFLSAELCGGVNKRSYVGAAMVELLHNATLIHDDVVDEASERRGMATINAEWSNKIAVLIGDFLLAKGLLSAIDGGEIGFLNATSKAVRRMSEGELLQIQKTFDNDIDEDIYFKIISDKTASLLSSCSEIGAISATDDPNYHNLLSQYGENIGIAFQIQDDIFDIESKSSILGKPVGNDLKEKKITLPLIYSFSKSSKSESSEIKKIIKNGKLSQKNIDKIVNFVHEKGGIEYSSQKARLYSSLAIEKLSCFDNTPAKESLINFANFVIERSF